MQVAVVGAGIVGVATAYELALLGHEVTVIERRGTVASEASYANAGVVAPDYGASWASSGGSGEVLRQIFRAHSPVRMHALGTLRQLPWLWHRWRADRPEVRAVSQQAMRRLAAFSRDRLLELTRKLQLEYEQMPGYWVLLRGEAELASAQDALALLRDWAVPHELVDGVRCRQLEPGLQPSTPLLAALHLPQDGVGNCRQFAHLLRAETQRLGARFRFDTHVSGLTPGRAGGTRPQIRLTSGSPPESFDAVVVCAGVQANALLQEVGLKLPLAPIYGYSVTAPLRHFDGHGTPGPRAAVMDARFKVAISRLGQRVRVAGCAEIGGSPDRISPNAIRTLYRVLDDWFPGAASTREAQHWKGARPMLPDGPPVLGDSGDGSGHNGVWLNLGHGSSGWALACGSARVLAERISGRDAPIDLSGLTLARLR